MAEIIRYPNVSMTILNSEDDMFKNGESEKVLLQYEPQNSAFIATLPVKKLVDRTPNDSIFVSKKIAFRVNVCKDKRLSPSGKISVKMIEKVGEEGLIGEFVEAAKAIWKQANPN